MVGILINGHQRRKLDCAIIFPVRCILITSQLHYFGQNERFKLKIDTKLSRQNTHDQIN